MHVGVKIRILWVEFIYPGRFGLADSMWWRDGSFSSAEIGQNQACWV